MAKVFKECLEELISMKTEFAPNQYPLAQFESVSPEIREDVLRKAEKKFNYSKKIEKWLLIDNVKYINRRFVYVFRRLFK